MTTQERIDALAKTQERIIKAKLPLSKTATNLVFGKGNVDAPIFFIGEAPGAKEDEAGLPFVGAAGRQLDRLLNSIGLSLEEVYIANILKYRPPNNRPPQAGEIKSHTPYLVEQIQVISPQVIVTLGNFATKFVLAKFNCDDMGQIEGITKLHGKPQPIAIGNRTFTVMPLYHPAAMLYNPPLRKTMDQDFLHLAACLKKSA